MTERTFTEDELTRIETARNPDSVPELIRTIRYHQRDIDSLRLKMDVAVRDRDELRSALLRCQEELRRLRGG